MKEDNHERVNKKLEELIDLIMNFPQIKRNFIPRDIKDTFSEMEFRGNSV